MASKCKEFPRIKTVKAYIQENTSDVTKESQGADCHDVTDEHWINGHPTPIANPMSRYPLYAEFRQAFIQNQIRNKSFFPVNRFIDFRF